MNARAACIRSVERSDCLDYQKFKQAKAVEKKNKERFLKVNPKPN